MTSRIRVGKFGPYIETERGGETVTASIPDSLAPADITNAIADNLIDLKQKGPQSLGNHPETDLPMFLMVGPFGPYIQLGEMGEEVPTPHVQAAVVQVA